MEVEPKRVLVIEENAETQQLLAQIVLGVNGCRPLTASNSEEGLKLAGREHPSLIILDLQPDGFEILKGLRERDFDIPVILTSSHPSPDMVVQAFRQGARDCIIKPIDSQEMQNAIQHALDSVQLREEREQLTRELRKANDQLQRQLQELNTLYTIGRSVTSLLDLNHVLNRVVEAAVYMTGAEEGMLMLLDEKGEELYLRAAKEIDERTARNLRIKVDDSAAGRALRLERPVHLADDRAKIATGYLVKSLLYVPLRVPGRGAIGVLGVTNREASKKFSERDIHLLSALADYAAIAIENAKLFKEVEAERAKLESVLREAEESIIVVDEKNRILLCNAAARTSLDLDDEDLVSQPANEVLSNPAMREMFSHGREAKRTVHREIALNNGRTLTPSSLLSRESVACW